MAALAPFQIAWTVGKIERELELLGRGRSRRFSAEFPDDHLKVLITVELTSTVKRVKLGEEEAKGNGSS